LGERYTARQSDARHGLGVNEQKCRFSTLRATGA